MTPKRLNLLPTAKQRELRFEQLFHSVSIAVTLAVLVLMLGIIAQLLAWIYLGEQQVFLTENIEQIKRAISKTEYSELKSEIKLANTQMKDFSDMAASQPQWSTVLNAFAAQVPQEVRITQFSADSATLKVTISGFSPTREKVIELYNNISNDNAHFKDIDYPLENVAKPTDVLFHFTFYISDGVLIAPPK